MIGESNGNRLKTALGTGIVNTTLQISPGHEPRLPTSTPA
jgi:hypothetical protein